MLIRIQTVLKKKKKMHIDQFQETVKRSDFACKEEIIGQLLIKFFSSSNPP